MCARQVAYPGDAVTVPFTITSPQLRVPAALQYTITASAGPDAATYIPKRALTGTLLWDTQPGRQLNLTIPVNWSSVPPEAEWRLHVRLAGAWRARLEGGNGTAGNITAVHIFGVHPGHCPPGTYRCSSLLSLPMHPLGLAHLPSLSLCNTTCAPAVVTGTLRQGLGRSVLSAPALPAGHHQLHRGQWPALL